MELNRGRGRRAVAKNCIPPARGYWWGLIRGIAHQWMHGERGARGKAHLVRHVNPWGIVDGAVG